MIPLPVILILGVELVAVIVVVVAVIYFGIKRARNYKKDKYRDVKY